jgi:methionyl-tRNA formyltransferase
VSVPQRILFCGTPTFAIPSLKALSEDPFFKVEMVATQPDRPAGRGHKLQPSPVKVFAEQKNIPVITPENISAPEVVKQISDLDLDACVVVAYGQILRRDFLNLFPQKCVNLHGSLLPLWRGAAPIQRSLMAGDKETGVSLQVVVSKLDAGAVIGERRFEVPENMNALESHDRMSALGVELFQNEFKAFLEGKITPRIQDESLVTYAHKIAKDETRIDWLRPASELHNFVRGLYMGPQAHTSVQGKNLKIYKTSVSALTGVPGEVVQLEKSIFSVACGSGSLDIHELQPESKKRLSAEEFLRGFPLRRGESFGS